MHVDNQGHHFYFVQELEEKKGLAYETNTAHNIYLDQGNEDIFSSDHIRNRKFPTRVNNIHFIFLIAIISK